MNVLAEHSPDYSQHVPAADRALRLLEFIAGSPHGVTSAALLERLGGSRSGLYALLNTLRSRGYLLSDEGRYVAGSALWSLVPSRPMALDSLIDAFRSVIVDAGFEETVAMAWPDGAGTVLTAVFPGVHTVRVVYEPGMRRPSTSVDAQVLAAGDPSGRSQLEAIRKDGIYVDRSPEVVEVAAPICDDGVHAVAALLMGIPSQRATKQTVAGIVDRLREAAARLSYRIGASVYKPYDWATKQPVGLSRDLAEDELDEFLHGPWSAQLAVVRADGAPHVVPLWYEWDGASMWVAASPGALWRSYVTDNAQVSVTLDEPWPPLRRVFVSGTATEVAPEDVPGGLADLRRRLAIRYLGRGAEELPELVDVEGWAAIRVAPERIRGRQGLGGTTLGDGL